MRQKRLVLSLLVMLAFLVSGFTYAFWASGIATATANQTGTVQVGTGTEVTSTVNLGALVSNAGVNNLVPVGFVALATDISSLTFTIPVDWDSHDIAGSTAGGDAAGITSTLTVSLVSAVIPAVAGPPAVPAVDVASHFGIALGGTGTNSAEYTIISDGATISVVITITLNEPLNQTQYNIIANANVLFTFSFTVAAAE